MFLHRIANALRKQDWTTVAIEFVIVVVGVFIGVQVSNWNADQQELRNAESYQARIIDDVRTDIDTLDGRIAYYQAVNQHLMATIAALDTDQPDFAEKLGKDFIINAYQGTQLWQFRESSDTYTELIASGKIHLFGDSELRSEVAQ
ncbi:MAG: DUF6090 family protein, partial [Gammaproteobacteria bacterium]|nr:DUF6090 family protein [Gammaproteobacteria bacterium]